MSTELKSTKGLREVEGPILASFELNEAIYTEAEMHVTSFNGGKRGRCIQLTPQDQYIQLDKAGVKDLVKTLNGWLENQ